MDFKMKIVCSFAPFGIAAAVGFSLLQPAFTDFSEKSQNVESRRHDSEELTTKLADRGKIMKEKQDLETAISSLRGSVPKTPDLELLNIDLEKMSLESGLDLISISSASKESLKKAGLDSEEPTTLGQTMSKNKAELANKVKAAAAPASAAAAAVAGAAGKGPAAGSVSPDAGLSKNTLQIKLIGDYKDLMAFTRKLETYQRVLAVSDVHVTLPKGVSGIGGGGGPTKAQLPDDTDLTENDNPGDPERLNVTMMITSYYLP